MDSCIYCGSERLREISSKIYTTYECMHCGEYFDESDLTDTLDEQPRFRRTRPRDWTEARERKVKPRQPKPEYDDYE